MSVRRRAASTRKVCEVNVSAFEGRLQILAVHDIIRFSALDDCVVVAYTKKRFEVVQ